MNAPEITVLDQAGSYAVQYAIVWYPTKHAVPCWWDGRSLVSAVFRPQIKHYRTRQQAERALKRAAIVASRFDRATYC